MFISKGFDALHTLDLEKANETSDTELNEISITEERILITKDRDFYNSFLIKKKPYKLILVKLGNMARNDLINFFSDKIENIITEITHNSLLILKRD